MKYKARQWNEASGIPERFENRQRLQQIVGDEFVERILHSHDDVIAHLESGRL